MEYVSYARAAQQRHAPPYNNTCWTLYYNRIKYMVRDGRVGIPSSEPKLPSFVLLACMLVLLGFQIFPKDYALQKATWSNLYCHKMWQQWLESEKLYKKEECKVKIWNYKLLQQSSILILTWSKLYCHKTRQQWMESEKLLKGECRGKVKILSYKWLVQQLSILIIIMALLTWSKLPWLKKRQLHGKCETLNGECRG